MVKEVQILHPLEGGGGEEAIGAGLMGGADALDAEGACELLEAAMHVEMDLHVFEVIEGAKIVLEEAKEAFLIRGQALSSDELEEVCKVVGPVEADVADIAVE